MKNFLATILLALPITGEADSLLPPDHREPVLGNRVEAYLVPIPRETDRRYVPPTITTETTEDGRTVRRVYIPTREPELRRRWAD